ncbi:haloacid dehalogenase-like hydrolase (HAD) superfamily protein [Tasmannia lanceolata]|uniref:haloacid dehalogenase-like hydrolase (HAD) superfamily protein n=1 Tax=Tasmannia lanceolata TaxID=3420 RepID=UPI0040645F46
MIKRQGLRFLFRQTPAADSYTNSIHHSLMALDKSLFPLNFCCFSQMGVPNRRCRNQGKFSADVCGAFRLNSGNGLSLKGCSDSSDGAFRRVDDSFHKAHALPLNRQLVRDSKIGLEEDMGFNLMNGRTAYERGSPLKFPDRPMPKKMVVAVDVDEVLGSFLSALNKFIADRYSLTHSVSEYYVYEFCKVWNCSRIEADIRVHEFFKTAHFKMGIHPIPGAQEALLRLSTFCNLSVVTSRQNAIKDHTIEWIEKHYPGLFQEIHFGNHFALDGQSRPKSDICRSLGAQVLIDDNPRYATECAEIGVKVLLFDYDNSYPWCKTGSAPLHPLVTKVHNWQEVEQHLASWMMVSS